MDLTAWEKKKNPAEDNREYTDFLLLKPPTWSAKSFAGIKQCNLWTTLDKIVQMSFENPVWQV